MLLVAWPSNRSWSAGKPLTFADSVNDIADEFPLFNSHLGTLHPRGLIERLLTIISCNIIELGELCSRFIVRENSMFYKNCSLSLATEDNTLPAADKVLPPWGPLWEYVLREASAHNPNLIEMAEYSLSILCWKVQYYHRFIGAGMCPARECHGDMGCTSIKRTDNV